MVTTRIVWGLAAMSLVACTEKKSADAATQTGAKPQPGGKPSVSSNGGGASSGEGGVEPAGDGSTAVCPPTGLFRRTSQMLGNASSPQCASPNAPARAFFGPITTAHRALVEGTSCLFNADEISEDGCGSRRLVTCDDGSSSDIQCDAQETGNLLCTFKNMNATTRCDVITEYEPDPAWSGRCDAMWGPYTRTSEQTGDGESCPEIMQAQEITDLSDLAIEPGCMLDFPTQNGSCTLTLEEKCDGGTGAMHVCKVSTDSSTVTCTVTLGNCVYEISLVR